MVVSQRGAAAFAALAGLLGSVTVANATLVSFTYNDLAATYVPANAFVPTAGGVFTASAVDFGIGNMQTSGVASRNVPVEGDALFEPGFVSNPLNSADFVLSVNVFNINAFGADSSGTFVATDADGDTISGTIAGLQAQGNGWLELFPGMIAFNGILTNVVFTDNGAADNTFNGSLFGGWNMSFAEPPPYEGALVNLTFGGPGLFGAAFANVASSLTAQIVPTPGALALLGLGGLVASRRRR